MVVNSSSASNSNSHEQKETKKLSDLLYMEIIRDFRQMPTKLRDNIINEIAKLFFAEFGRSIEATTDICLNQKSIRVYALLVREKNSNNLIGAIVSNIFLIMNLPNNSTLENTFLVPIGGGAVSEKYRNLKKSRYALETLQKYIIDDYPNHNLIYYAVFSNPLGFYLFASTAKFSFPDFSQSKNSLLEAFMEKVSKAYNNKDLKRVSNDNVFLHEGHRPVNFDRQYLIDNYKSLPNPLKFFIDVTGLKPGYGVIGLYPIIMQENNTLNLCPGDNYPNRLVFDGEIRLIDSNSYRL